VTQPKDRFRYFRIEARELLDALSRGVLDLEKSPGDRAIVARLLRHAHTLKGAARVVGQPAIADLAHAAEDALGPHRDEGSPPVPRDRVDALLRILDAIATAVGTLDAAPQRPADASAASAAPEDPIEAVRVDLRELDALFDAVLEAGVQATALRRGLGRLDRARELAQALGDALRAGRRGEEDGAGRVRPLVDELRRSIEDARRAMHVRADHAEREIAHVRDSADRLRLLPARALFGSLERSARDAGRTADRAVAFATRGGEVRVDAHVLSAIRDALLHAVRNAVAHGIEPAAERVALGKPAAGTVRVTVERRGSRVAFRCEDDGRGLDAAAIRNAAVRRGLVAPGEAAGLDAHALARLLLRGGVSTAAAVSELSGRGVGLDVVRDTAARLKAEVAITSEPGRGTAIELAVPISLAAIQALHVEAGGAPAALPLDAVEQTAWLPADAIARTPDGAVVPVDGALVPFLPLARVLGRPEPQAPRRHWSAVVVRAGAERVAVGADRLLGAGDVVVRPLPPWVEATAAVAGAALDPEGNPRLVLDPAGLLAAVRAAPAVDAPAPAPLPPILVVDDSLTTRMLEESILTSAGYAVDLAVSAEEALDKARAARYGLFVVDVEMPGMDGFEFVRTTRADPRLAAIPAILVTSRGAPEDRRRGAEAGASAYIVKGEFDQGRLLSAIRELLG
jgi:two-component system chemotaxis sensor kinase CheA